MRLTTFNKTCVEPLFLFFVCVFLFLGCSTNSPSANTADTKKAATDKTAEYTNFDTTVKNDTMSKAKKHPQKNQGASKNSAAPKKGKLSNEAVQKKSGPDKVVNIGMPVSKEEMDRLKQKAAKPDH